MILIPQRLFNVKDVKTILRDGNVCILKKRLTEPVLKREGYISNHVVSIVLAGQQKIRTYEGNHITVNAGEILFIPRGVYHITDLLPQQGAFESLLFYFDDSVIQTFLSNTKVTNIYRASVPDHLKFDTVPSIHLFAENILQVYGQGLFPHKQFLKLKILELLYLLHSLTTAQDFANFLFQLTLPKKRNIKSFMEQNFDKPLKVEDYAYLTGRSLSTFRRDFKAYFQITPQKWLKEKRLDKAMQIIDNQNITVTELAFEVGYEHISYFIKAFKNKFGRSPKQYMIERRMEENQ